MARQDRSRAEQGHVGNRRRVPDYIVELYQQVCVHSDIVLSTVELDSVVSVPWWPVELQHMTVAGLLARVLKDTAMHAGQLQILRELIDGEAGSDRADAGDAEWWQGYRPTRASRDAISLVRPPSACRPKRGPGKAPRRSFGRPGRPPITIMPCPHQ